MQASDKTGILISHHTPRGEYGKYGKISKILCPILKKYMGNFRSILLCQSLSTVL